MPRRTCAACGAEFVATRPSQLACSSSCRAEAWRQARADQAHESLATISRELARLGALLGASEDDER